MFRRLIMFMLMLALLLVPLMVCAIWPFGSWGGGGENSRDVLLDLGDGDTVSMHDIASSVLICGGPGCGKTTGSQANLEHAYVSHSSKPGVLWCCVKNTEPARALATIRNCGRQHDNIIVFGPDHPNCIDLFHFQVYRPGGGPEAANEFANRLALIASGASQMHKEGTWQLAGDNRRAWAMRLILLAGEQVNAPLIYQVITSAAKNLDQAKSKDWATRSTCGQLLMQAEERAMNGLLTEEQRRERQDAMTYWILEAPGEPGDYRGSVDAAALLPVNPFLHGNLRKIFASGKSNFHPQMVLDGAIVLFQPELAVEMNPYNAVPQAGITMMVQEAALQASVKKPVAIFRDECPKICHRDHDAGVLAEGRSSLLTHIDTHQSCPQLYSALGGGLEGQEQAQAFMAAHQIKVLHANSCPISNQYWSNMIGVRKELMMHISPRAQKSPQPHESMLDQFLGTQGHGVSLGEQYQPYIQPSYFAGAGKLRTGGKRFNYVVDALIYRANAPFAHGRHHRRVTFKQII